MNWAIHVGHRRAITTAAAVAALAGALWTPLAPVALAQPLPPGRLPPVATSRSVAPTDPGRPAENLAVLKNAAAEPAVRAAAAKRLLMPSEDPEQRRVISELLSPAGDPNNGQGVLLAEIASMSAAPAWLCPVLTTLAESTPPEQLPKVIAALSSIRNRDAIRTLINLATSAPSPTARDAALSALVRLTGRADIGPSARRWAEWFAQVEFLTEPDWQRLLAEGLAEAADRSARDRETAMVRLTDANLQRYLDSATGEPRWNLLAALLKDDLPRIRRQGVNLVKTELANARIPGKPVAAAAAGLLKDYWPDLRRAGAELIDSLGADGAESAIVEALLTETDETVAAALLKTGIRYPTAALKPLVLQWLARPGPARRSAIDAAGSLVDRNLLSDETERNQVLSILRAIDPASLPPTGLRMMVTIGTDEDRAIVTTLLSAPQPAIRTAAAESLTTYAPALDDLVKAALADPTLFRHAAGAIGLHRRSLEGFLRALALPCESPEVRRDALAAIAAGLDPGDLLAAARETDDPILRDRLLTRLESIPLRRPLFGGEASTPEPSVVAGLLLLAQTRLELGQPAAALTTLEALEPVAAGIDQTRHSSLATVALLWLDRIDDAALLAAPATAWLDGLEKSLRLDHARDVANTIRARFNGTLTDAETTRLNTLESRLASRSESSGATPEGTTATARTPE